MRHGRSLADDEAVHEGRYDSPLTEVGRRQAQQRATDFVERGLSFDTIIASTLQRANETACIIASVLNTPVENDLEWMEKDNGQLAGLPFDVAETRYPKPAILNPYTPLGVTGESHWDIYLRAAKAVQKLVQRGPGSYLVVAHGGILNMAVRAMIGAAPGINQPNFSFGFGDTGYMVLDYYPTEHHWVLREFVRGV